MRTTVGGLFGGDSEDEKLELILDGQRLKLFQIGQDVVLNTLREKLDVHVNLKAGRHDVGATFLSTTYVPNVDLSYVTVPNRASPIGGTDPESVDSMRYSISRGGSRLRQRAVTLNDYAELAMQVPGVTRR